MLKKVTKIIAIVMIAIMAFSVLYGCQRDKKELSDNSESSSKEQTSRENKEHINKRTTITVARWVVEPTDAKNTVIEKELEKKLKDIDIVSIPVERSNWKDQLSTMIAGGNIPDIIFVDSHNDVANLVNQGALAEISISDIKENMSGYWKVYDKYGYDIFMFGILDSKNYGIPNVNPAMTRAMTNGWRKDWLENVGIDKSPETLEEYEEAFGKFRNNDPDGNGEKDTYAVSFAGKNPGVNNFAVFYGAYGVFPNMWIKDNGKAVWGGVAQGAKKALALLNRWYEKELIDPEFVIDDSKIITQKWANSKIGYVESTWYRLVPAVVYWSGEHYEALEKINPNAEIEMANAPKGPDGKFGYFGWSYITGGIVFGKQMENNSQKVAKALKYIDAVSADDETFALAQYGVQNEHWELDENGNIKDIPPYDKPEGRTELGRGLFTGLNNPDGKYFKKEPPELYAKAIAGNVKANTDYYPGLPVLMPSNSKYIQNLNILQAKWQIQFITGEKSLDEFDTYVKEWMDAGGSVLTDEANKALAEWDESVKTIVDSIK